MKSWKPFLIIFLSAIAILSCSKEETEPFGPKSENDREWTFYPFDFSVKSLAIDNQDNIFVGFYRDRLAQFDGEKWSYFEPEISNIIESIAVDSKNRIWIGGGYNEEDPDLAVFENSKWTIFSIKDFGTGSYIVLEVACAPNDDIWVGTAAGIACFNGTSWKSFTPFDSTFTPGKVQSISFDQEGHAWAAAGSSSINSSPHNGLYKYDGHTWTQNSGLPDNYVTAIACDSAGNIWCGCGVDYGSIVKFDGSQWTVLNSQNSTLKSDPIAAITCDAEGTVWICDRYNLYKSDGKTLTFIEEPFGHNLWFIEDIEVDSKGNVWIGQSKGIAVYRPNGVHSSQFGFSS